MPVSSATVSTAASSVAPGTVEQPGNSREVVLRGEPAAHAHHGLAGLGAARALFRTLAAVVAEPGIKRGAQWLFQAQLQVMHRLARKNVGILGVRANRTAIAALVALRGVLRPEVFQLVDQIRICTNCHVISSSSSAGQEPAGEAALSGIARTAASCRAAEPTMERSAWAAAAEACATVSGMSFGP